MADETGPPNDTKALFRSCGTCSQALGCVVDRRFGNPAIDYERALSRLAGGIANRGHQCGLLWGSSMGVGLEAGQRCSTPHEAVGLALVASRQLHASLEAHAQTVTCRDITRHRLDTIRGRAAMMFDTLRHGGLDNTRCFVLAEAWTPDAILAAEDGLDVQQWHACKPKSCASEVVLAMGGSDDEAVAVAGFGGGLGLSGNTCGALAAAVWMKGLRWVREHGGSSPGPRTDTGDEQTLQAFEAQTGGAYACEAICGQRFDSVDAHTRFLDEGGCRELIDVLAES